MCLSAPFTASDQRYQWLSCHALTSAIPGLSQLVLAPYRNLIPYKPWRRPDASTTMPRLAYRRAVVPVSIRYNIPVVPPGGFSAAPKNRDRDSPGAENARISPWTMSMRHLPGAFMHYTYRSISGTTSPLYHLQVPVQHLRIMTETAHGRRTSTLAENRYLPMSTVHSSRPPMHWCTMYVPSTLEYHDPDPYPSGLGSPPVWRPYSLVDQTPQATQILF